MTETTIYPAYVRHFPSGECYAVQVGCIETGDGLQSSVLSACGPLHYRECTMANLRPVWNFNNDAELVAEMNMNWQAYTLTFAYDEED